MWLILDLYSLSISGQCVIRIWLSSGVLYGRNQGASKGHKRSGETITRKQDPKYIRRPLALCATLRHRRSSVPVKSCSEYDEVRDVPRHCFSQVDNENGNTCMQKSIRNRDTKSVYEQTAPLCYSIQTMLYDKHSLIAYFTPDRY